MDPSFRGAAFLLSVRVEGCKDSRASSWQIIVQERARFVDVQPVMPSRRAHVAEERRADFPMGIEVNTGSFRSEAII